MAGLRRMDAERMDFADGSFDKAVAMYVVSVVPDPVRFVDDVTPHGTERLAGGVCRVVPRPT